MKRRQMGAVGFGDVQGFRRFRGPQRERGHDEIKSKDMTMVQKPLKTRRTGTVE